MWNDPMWNGTSVQSKAVWVVLCELCCVSNTKRVTKIFSSTGTSTDWTSKRLEKIRNTPRHETDKKIFQNKIDNQRCIWFWGISSTYWMYLRLKSMKQKSKVVPNCTKYHRRAFCWENRNWSLRSIATFEWWWSWKQVLFFQQNLRLKNCIMIGMISREYRAGKRSDPPLFVPESFFLKAPLTCSSTGNDARSWSICCLS